MNKLFNLIRCQLYDRFKNNIKASLFSYWDLKCTISSKSKIKRFVLLRNVELNEYSYIGSRTKILNTKIGKYCSIGPDCRIGLAKHPLNFISTSPIFYSDKNPFNKKWVKYNNYEEEKRIIIGNDVWIGSNVIVKGGIKIGNGAVIGAGAVVTKEVSPYSIVAGVPAKLIKKRFDEKTIKQLEKVKWWNWSEEKMKENKDLFLNNELFFKKIFYDQ